MAKNPAVALKLDENIWTRTWRKIGLPITSNKTREYFTQLSTLINQDVQNTFRSQGARSGRTKWAELSARTRARRVGSDGKVHENKANGPILQVTGRFRKSFEVKKITNKSLIFGTKLKNPSAKNIMSAKNRKVLDVDARDRRRYKNYFMLWYRRGLL